jgi:hypothetical protein
VQVTIENQARHLLICTLNSGKTLHLTPAQTSEPVDHLEINGNQKINKLVQAGLVVIETMDREEMSAATQPQRQGRERE